MVTRLDAPSPIVTMLLLVRRTFLPFLVPFTVMRLPLPSPTTTLRLPPTRTSAQSRPQVDSNAQSSGRVAGNAHSAGALRQPGTVTRAEPRPSSGSRPRTRSSECQPGPRWLPEPQHQRLDAALRGFREQDGDPPTEHPGGRGDHVKDGPRRAGPDDRRPCRRASPDDPHRRGLSRIRIRLSEREARCIHVEQVVAPGVRVDEEACGLWEQGGVHHHRDQAFAPKPPTG